MSAVSSALPRRLPPLARGRDWLAAGLGAGLCLGAAESLALLLQGTELPPTQALALVAADAAAGAAVVLPAALGARLLRWRPRHSAVAAGAVTVVLLLPVLPRLLALFAAPGSAQPGIVAGAGMAVLVGALAAWTGSRLEGAGLPISGPPIWAAASLLVAVGGAIRAGGPIEPGAGVYLALGALVLALALLAALMAVVGARRKTVAPWPPGRVVLALAALAAAIALAPRLLPWLLLEAPTAGETAREPDILILDLGSFAAGQGPAVRESRPDAPATLAPNLTLLATAGVLYRRVLVPSAADGALEWLRLPGGTPVASALRARGYLPRFAGTESARLALPPGFESAAGARSDVEAAVRASVGGALLARFGADVGRPPPATARAAQVTAEARRRIASARALQPERPLLLVLDYGAAERSPARLDEAIGSLVDFLYSLGIDAEMRIVVAWREEDGAAGRGGVRALVRPEPAARGAERGAEVVAPVLASDVALRVLEVAP